MAARLGRNPLSSAGIADPQSAKTTGEGKEIDWYICGRKGEAYFRFRDRPIVKSWTGFSDQPTEIGWDTGRVARAPGRS